MEPEEIKINIETDLKVAPSLTNEEKEENKKKVYLQRKNSKFSIMDSKSEKPLYRPEFDFKKDNEEKRQKLWNFMSTYIETTTSSIQKQIIDHIEFSLARTRFNFDSNTAFQATALSVRDRMIESWNDTNEYMHSKNPKRVYYLSMEYLPGRLLQNNLVNLNIEEKYATALQDIGFKLEDLYEEEVDPALGNGGLGRLAACYMDSLTTLNYPAWGYGLRFSYGIFKQIIKDGRQIEVPDYWLEHGNPWELERPDILVPVHFYGRVEEGANKKKKWVGTQMVYAMACDNPISGYNTFNCNNLRLWKSIPANEFDFKMFNSGDYFGAIEQRQLAECITSVLYPNDNTPAGKELRLKQEYFFVAATMHDIFRRFIQSYESLEKVDFNDFPSKAAIQLNDTHPALAIIEALRLLVDVYNVEENRAFKIVKEAFAYTNHTVLPEALEKWSVELIERLLPRHLQIIYALNHQLLGNVVAKYPTNNLEKQRIMSCVEEFPIKMIRMANICIIASHRVNGVAAIHSKILQTSLFRDFFEFEPKKFINITNGVTQRRWLLCCNKPLYNLITETLDESYDYWLSDMINFLPNLESSLDNQSFIDKWEKVKIFNKKRLAAYVKKVCGIEISTDAMYDVMIKRFHEYKRQLMNILQVILRYLAIKATKKEERKFVPKVIFFGGKAAPGYADAKAIIALINAVSRVVNSDTDVGDLLKVVFLPNYNVSSAQIIIPGADISEHISMAGMEASGTSNMKFVMNGSLILGTLDGANIEIADAIGRDNMIIFGKDVNEVNQIKKEKRNEIPANLRKVIDYVRSNKFGEMKDVNALLTRLLDDDRYLIGADFNSYLDAQMTADRYYFDKKKMTIMSIKGVANCGYFSSDRSIKDYVDKIWNVSPYAVPNPSSDQIAHQRHDSSEKLTTVPII